MSVIVRTRDRPELLREALQSIISQSYRPIEVVVVNDGGEDIANIIKKFGKDEIKIQYICHRKTLGRAAAANTGLNAATGEWVGFLDDDDLLLPHAVEKLLLYGKAAGAVYGKVELSLLMPNGSWKTLNELGQPFSREALFLCNYIPTCGFIFKRKLLEKVGPFDEEFAFLEDWDFIYRLAREVDFVFVPEKVAIYRLFGRGYVIEVQENQMKELPWRTRFYRKHLPTISPEELAEGYFAFLRIHGLQLDLERQQRIALEIRTTNLEQQLQAILNSRSWRFTKPLRDLKTFLQKLRSFVTNSLRGKDRQ
ncbi:glycosyltransferase [Thermosulfurimonas sp. F29]|uniref:glycosyltransferase family 2 protein n=1 Tax=Thermosulfurimonas sp. F29 TaxID=2867247 RepID=UPI001C82A5B5|nr:glycosyltransferase [Thermosulfurimonas sp. F29]MBX6424295.1 glycosyltransferase [Thermosulfurimonas sp. F29]